MLSQFQLSDKGPQTVKTFAKYHYRFFLEQKITGDTVNPDLPEMAGIMGHVCTK